MQRATIKIPSVNKKKMRHFHEKRLLAIDYGTKVIGLSTFCPGRDPFPLLLGKIITEKGLPYILSALKGLIEEENIEYIILGLPVHKDGNPSEMTKKVLAFKKNLESQFPNITIYEQDETLTSYEAKERMKASPRFNFQIDMKSIDMVAACIILEDFMKDEKEIPL